VLDCQTVTLSVALDNVQQGVTQNKVDLIFASSILYIVFIMFVRNHGVESASNDLVQSEKCIFHFWNNSEFQYTLTCRNLPPGK